MNTCNNKGIISIVLIPVIFIIISLTACDEIIAPKETPCTTCSNSDSDTDTDTDTDIDNNNDNTEPHNSYIGVRDDNFFVKQGNSLCGPTSFYMIFKYYGDPYKDAVLSSSCECLEDTILSGVNEIFSVILDTSWITLWLDSVIDGIDCNNFHKKISNLSQCTGNTSFPFYSVVDGSCELTGEAPEEYNADANTERRDRFNYILEYFLQKQYPVILHLRRTYDDYPYLWYPGHYVVLMGYDTDTKDVFIMDPFQEPDSYRVMTVTYDSFIMQRWYQTTGLMSSIYPDARWDGTWIGFHH